MNKEDLIELREIFRKKMDEHDFCIGQEQVERIFRKLLNEPEPVYEKPFSENIRQSKITLNEVVEVMKGSIIKSASNAFERDDTFYTHMRRK